MKPLRDWYPSDALYAWVRAKHPLVDVTVELAKFRDESVARGHEHFESDWDEWFTHHIRQASLAACRRVA